jgi:hypothetical protein
MPRRHWVAAALTWLTVGAAPLAAQGLADYDYDNLSFRGVGLDWGYISPTKVDDTSLWGLRIDLGYLGPAIRVVPSLTFWSSTMRASELNRLATALENLPPLSSRGIDITADDLGIVEWSDLALNLDLHAVWTAPFDVFAYIGAGLGIHALNGRGDAIDDTFIEDLLDTTTAGVSAMAGLEYQPVPRLRFYGEARYVLASDVRFPAVRIGLAFMLPSSANTYSGGSRP